MASGLQPACPAQQAIALEKSISSTTRPRSNRSASAAPGDSDVTCMLSVSIWLVVEQRKRAEHTRRVGCGRLVQAGFVDLGERGRTQEAETAQHFVLEQLQHPRHAGFAGGRQRPALQPADADE